MIDGLCWKRRHEGARGVALIAGASLGAALMYALDPERGRRRRALARDQIGRAARRSGRRVGALSRDLRNRSQGLVARALSPGRGEESAGGSAASTPPGTAGEAPERGEA